MSTSSSFPSHTSCRQMMEDKSTRSWSMIFSFRAVEQRRRAEGQRWADGGGRRMEARGGARSGVRRAEGQRQHAEGEARGRRACGGRMRAGGCWSDAQSLGEGVRVGVGASAYMSLISTQPPPPSCSLKKYRALIIASMLYCYTCMCTYA